MFQIFRAEKFQFISEITIYDNVKYNNDKSITLNIQMLASSSPYLNQIAVEIISFWVKS